MGKIFCIMGKSGSGKDTIFKSLINDKELYLNPVTLYTTRPKRQGETDGVEYFFINDKKLEELQSKGKIIELRQYNTVNGIWYYCTVNDGQIMPDKNYLLICTLEAYNNIRKYFGEQFVIPIYISVDDGVRLQRALNREISQQVPQYEEMCRRFLADSEDFSEDKLRQSNITQYFNNDKLITCVKEARQLIIKELIKEK